MAVGALQVLNGLRVTGQTVQLPGVCYQGCWLMATLPVSCSRGPADLHTTKVKNRASRASRVSRVGRASRAVDRTVYSKKYPPKPLGRTEGVHSMGCGVGGVEVGAERWGGRQGKEGAKREGNRQGSRHLARGVRASREREWGTTLIAAATRAKGRAAL